jgi:hypothetical protein
MSLSRVVLEHLDHVGAECGVSVARQPAQPPLESDRQAQGELHSLRWPGRYRRRYRAVAMAAPAERAMVFIAAHCLTQEHPDVHRCHP